MQKSAEFTAGQISLVGNQDGAIAKGCNSPGEFYLKNTI